MNIVNYITNITFNNKYITLILITIFTLIIRKIIISIAERIITKVNDSNRLKYKILQFVKIIVNITEILAVYLLWEDNIKNVITVISFISAAVTLSLKDFIFNFFASIYIKLNKPFVVEDRIEINGYKGDVVNLGALSFEILEISEEYGNQSTGIILEIPNSTIFSYPLKNMNKGFKYVWDEVDIKVNLDSDVEAAKSIIYQIINSIDLLKSIPNNMKKELKSNTTYRMYYNKYSPIIYTDVVDNNINLKLRYLVDPKKSRIVKSSIWNSILTEYRDGNINLVKND